VVSGKTSFAAGVERSHRPTALRRHSSDIWDRNPFARAHTGRTVDLRTRQHQAAVRPPRHHGHDAAERGRDPPTVLAG